MASSRGRARLAESQKRSFAFGSSTPRVLSHIGAIPPAFRAIDPRSQKDIAARLPRSSSTSAETQRYLEKPKNQDLSFYIRRAHHARNQHANADDGKVFAFGSSTPREFSHLNKILPKLRVYNAKVEKERVIPIRSPSLNAPKLRKPDTSQKRAIPKKSKDEDDIASEPDIVQDRNFEFMIEAMAAMAQSEIQLSRANNTEVKENVPATGETTPGQRPSTAQQSEVPAQVERVQEFTVEASQPTSLIKPIESEISASQVVTMPVVQSHDTNPVLIEDNNDIFFEEAAAEAHGEALNLGDIQSLSVQEFNAPDSDEQDEKSSADDDD